MSLDQRIAAGIGNIWKCESLYARGVDPRTRTPVGDLDADTIAAIYASARQLMLSNLKLTAPRASRDLFAVDSKTNRPCARCATPISAYQLATLDRVLPGEAPRWGPEW